MAKLSKADYRSARRRPKLPPTMLELLQAGRETMVHVTEVVAKNGPTYPLEAERHNIKTPDTQVWFNKQVSCINRPYNPVHLPRVSTMLDYEVELGVAVGRKCRYVTREQARSVIPGYTVCNGITVSDWQIR